MSLQELIPSPELSKTEIDLLREVFRSPVVAKYLRILSLNDTKELLNLTGIGRSPEELVAAHHITSGKLATLSTLLSLTKE